MFSRRIATAVLVVVLSGGGAGLCAGWEPTPEARMACCTDEGTCAMHKGAGRAASGVTQAQADSCCAMSEQDDATPATATFVRVVSLGLVVSPLRDAGSLHDVRFDVSRTLVPLPGSHVPKHLLLSVFLI